MRERQFIQTAPQGRGTALGCRKILATCVVFASLTGRSPVGTPHTAGIDTPTAAFLQAVAWETVQGYYAK